MMDRLHLPDYPSPAHQQWLIAETRACHDAVRTGIALTQELIEQSRKLATEAWRTLRQSPPPLRQDCHPRGQARFGKSNKAQSALEQNACVMNSYPAVYCRERIEDERQLASWLDQLSL